MPDPQQTLGRYHLLDRISVGGMAEIFRAKVIGEAGFEKVVALKCILPQMADDRAFVEMFIDEARTVSQLNHVNICQVFEFGQENGTYYIALELVEGKDLKHIMERHQQRGHPVPLSTVLYVVCRICEALDYAHNCCDSRGALMNIVHRDISPQNILLSYTGDVKLIDFGIAKAVGRLTKTVVGSIKGKFGYMSPEQVSGQRVDLRSDIFACGTVLWELLTNTRLFKGENEMASMHLIRMAEVDPPSSINPELSPSLDRIVLGALEREPDQRYQSAGQLLDDIEQFALESGHTCSARQLARWMKQELAEDASRTSEQEQPTLPSPQLMEAQTSLLQRDALPVTVTGRGTVSTTATDTEYIVISSAKPWIVAGVLFLLLVGGIIAVVSLWPEQTVVHVPAAPPLAPHTSSIPEVDSAVPSADARLPVDSAASTPDAAVAARHITRPSSRPRVRMRPPQPVPAPTRPPRAGRPPARPDPPRRGILLVASRPWARVWIDGVDTGRNTPIHAGAPLLLAPGTHRVTLLINDQRFDYTVNVVAGETTKLIKKLPAKR